MLNPLKRLFARHEVQSLEPAVPPSIAPANPEPAPLKVIVDQEVCHHCGACVAVCPPDAIFLEGSFLGIDQQTCTACQRCTKMCPVHALSMAVTPAALTKRALQ